MVLSTKLPGKCHTVKTAHGNLQVDSIVVVVYVAVVTIIYFSAFRARKYKPPRQLTAPLLSNQPDDINAGMQLTFHINTWA